MEQFSYELEALKGVIIRPLIVFVLLAAALFTIGTPPLGTQLFLSAKAFLIPAGVSMVVLGPSTAFVAPLLMVVLVALLATFPYMVYSFVRFLIPALRERERRVLRFVVASSLILFYLGCALAYFIIIPETFSILYSFAIPLAVTPFFSLDAFISSVFLLTLGVGVLFLLPVVMVLLTYIGVLPQTFGLPIGVYRARRTHLFCHHHARRHGCYYALSIGTSQRALCCWCAYVQEDCYQLIVYDHEISHSFHHL